MPRFAHRLSAFLLLTLLPSALLAQAPAPAGNSSISDEAQRRYSRALELFNEGTYDAALLEFRRAYDLAPSWRILYNIGQVNVQLNDYARALDAFERYLSEGGAEVPAARSTEVKGQIDRLTARVALLDITTNTPGAEINVDDLPVGKTPLAKPLRVNVGRRKVAVTALGRLPQSRVVEAAGGDKIKLDFNLVLPESASTATGTATGTAPPPPPSPHVFWPGVIATGVLGAGALVTGLLSVSAKSDFNDKKDRFNVSRGELDDAHAKTTRLSVVTDILLGATIVTGGVSLYLSLRTPKTTTTGQLPGPSLGLRVGPSALGLQGSF